MTTTSPSARPTGPCWRGASSFERRWSGSVDTVGTGGESRTRFPIGISFPAGSGLVAFAAATGVMLLDMPESVLVRFKGQMQPGATLRDLVNAIPLYAIRQGLLTFENKR